MKRIPANLRFHLANVATAAVGIAAFRMFGGAFGADTSWFRLVSLFLFIVFANGIARLVFPPRFEE